MKKFNILFLGGGKRVELAKKFKQNGFSVYAYCKDFDEPIASEATVIKGEPFSNFKFQKDLKEKCRFYSIDVVISLECSASLHANSITCENTQFCLANKAAYTCYNKRKFYFVFVNNELSQYYPFPVQGQLNCIKPTHGNGGKGVRFSENIADLPYEEVAQLFIDGIEYSVDGYFNKSGFSIGAVVRLRSSVLGGEVVESEIVDDKEISSAAIKIAKAINITGPYCMQFIRRKTDNKLFVIECNARLGGGATLSIEAGLDIPYYIYKEYCLEEGVYDKPEIKKLKMKRCFRDTYFDEQNRLVK